MSIAAAQANKFYDEVVRTGVVFTFVDSGSFLVFSMAEGEVVPFWSSESRLSRVEKLHPKYREFEKNSIDLDTFLATTLPHSWKKEFVSVSTGQAADSLDTISTFRAWSATLTIDWIDPVAQRQQANQSLQRRASTEAHWLVVAGTIVGEQ